MKDLVSLLRTHRNHIFIAGLLIILGLQFVQVSRVLQEASSHLSLVSAFDDDARMVLDKTLKTRWYKDNGVAGYGPVYFRWAHSLASITSGHPVTTTETASQAVERNAHFVLLFVSLVSVFGLALLLSVLLTTQWNLRLVISISLLSAFLANPTWALFTVRAHPDHFFALLVTVASFLTLFSLRQQENASLFKGSAAAWGLVTGTKLSVVFHLPALLLMWIPPLNKQNLKTAGRYAMWAFIGYFIVCFPQSLKVVRPIQFLLSQSAYSTTPDLHSVLEWLWLYFDQAWRPTLIVVASWLCIQLAASPQPRFKIALDRRFFILLFLPFALLLTRQVISSHDHYIFPFVGTFLLAVVLMLGHIKLPQLKLKMIHYIWLVLPLIGLCTWGLVPNSLAQAKIQMSACRPEGIQLENDLREMIQAADKVHVDPYIPLNPTEYAEGQVQVGWKMTWGLALERKYNILVLNSKYYKRYANSNEDNIRYIQNYNPNWKETAAFYVGFVDKEKVTDTQGQSWKLIKNVPDCHWQVWRRQ